MEKKIKIIQRKSTIGKKQKVKDNLLGLGLRGIGSVVSLVETKENMGMVRRVSHMIYVVKDV